MGSLFIRKPALLTRMTRVMEQLPEEDEPSDKALRKMYENRPEDFMAMYERAEVRSQNRGKKRREAQLGQDDDRDEEEEGDGGVGAAVETPDVEEHREKMEAIIDRLKASWAARFPKSGNGVAR